MIKQAGGLVKAMKLAGCEINEQCGVHVHVDARDFLWRDIVRLCKVWSIIEPVMFAIGGQQRVTSSWCKPMGDRFAKAIKRFEVSSFGKNFDKTLNVEDFLLGEIWDGQDPSVAKRIMRGGVSKKSGGRYKAINLLPWIAGAGNCHRTGHEPRHDSTIEFRLHRELGTLDGNRLTGWMKLVTRIVDWTKKATDEDVTKLSKNAARALAETIAPDCKPWIVSRIKGWRSHCRRHKRRIKYNPNSGYAIAV
jgi:hypothetical protein